MTLYAVAPENLELFGQINNFKYGRTDSLNLQISCSDMQLELLILLLLLVHQRNTLIKGICEAFNVTVKTRNKLSPCSQVTHNSSIPCCLYLMCALFAVLKTNQNKIKKKRKGWN